MKQKYIVSKAPFTFTYFCGVAIHSCIDSPPQVFRNYSHFTYRRGERVEELLFNAIIDAYIKFKRHIVLKKRFIRLFFTLSLRVTFNVFSCNKLIKKLYLFESCFLMSQMGKEYCLETNSTLKTVEFLEYSKSILALCLCNDLNKTYLKNICEYK